MAKGALSICVCGAGTMGGGIAQVTATAGLNTVLFDVNYEMLQKAKGDIEKGLEIMVERGKLNPTEKVQILSQLIFTSTIQQCKADVIIEAIIEKENEKVELFNQLAAINGTQTIYTSNTSSLSLTKIASQIPVPQQFIGLHFFNPAPVMKLVEVVKTDVTSDEIVTVVLELAKRLGKTPVVCNDAPGFIVNRVARPFYIEALRLAEEGVASFKIIDSLLEAQGFKMGPFKLMDLIGNDVNYAVSCSVYEQLNGPERLKPSPLQKEKVELGELGKKTGKGYYDY